MARIGLKYAVYCPMTNSETEALGTGAVVGKAISADIQVKTSEAKLYADDGLAESVKEFISGTLSLEVDELADAVAAALNGHTITTGEIKANADDTAPFVRLGIIIPKMISNVKKYRAVCLTKVKFSIPSEKSDTKGESITFGTSTLPAEFFRNKDGYWKFEKTFDTELLAKAYLNPLVSIT